MKVQQLVNGAYKGTEADQGINIAVETFASALNKL